MKVTFKLILGYLRPRCLYALLRRQIWIRMHPDVPWLTRQAVEILGDRLKPTDVGLEWGSGRSTIWLAQRVAHLTSIEHNGHWYKRIKNLLSVKGLDNVDLLYATLESKGGMNPAYVSIAAESAEGGKAGLDFVLVDGRLRDQCTQLAIRLIKPGGMLIIDDAARYIQHPYCCPQSVMAKNGPPSTLWAKITAVLDSLDAQVIWTSDGVTATVFYFIPPA